MGSSNFAIEPSSTRWFTMDSVITARMTESAYESIKWMEDHIPKSVDLRNCLVMKWCHVGAHRDEEWLVLLPDGTVGFLGLDRQLGFASSVICFFSSCT